MMFQKVKSMAISKKYSYDYWDGKRQFGYGGYKYDGGGSIAKKLVKKYQLKNSKVLDIGGKGHLIYELSKLLTAKYI